jgi:hypothetical protein
VSGRVYAKVYGSITQAFEWPGLVDTVSLAIAQNVIQLPDRTQSGGGVYKEIRRIQSIAMTLNHREFYPSTLARAVFGESSEVSGAAVVAEEQVAYLGQFTPLNHPGPYTALTVTNDDTAPGAIAAESYEVRGAGLWINEDAADISDGDTILIGYTHPDYNRIQALTSSPPELEVFFEGINEARDDLPTPARFHRVRFGPAEALQLMSGDDFGALSLSGEVLKDLTKTGAGISQYFYSDIVVPAA